MAQTTPEPGQRSFWRWPSLAMPRPADGLHYRPDIDGLRAVAVLPVVFYHFGVWPFTGGYVGVDVFFVISGYLITSLIHTEIEEKRFSVIKFYERRVRRIFPALFAMIAVTTVAALIGLFPDTLVRFGRTLPPTAFFASNFEFVHRAGYFDISSSQKPLLHTWSLAVEEQFYLLFPGLMILLRGARRRPLLVVLGLILAASLSANIWGIRHSAVATFFLLPYRFWELLIGGMLAVGRFPAPSNALVRNLICAIGLVLIAVAVFGFSTTTPYPGENAIAPCVGAALIIYAGSGARTELNALLAAPLLVAIGLISYSLYLWHWPVFVIAKAYAFGALGPLETTSLIALSFVLAVLSWRYVELPFRGSGGLLSRRALFAAGFGAMVATAAVGGVIEASDGFPRRYNPAVRTLLAEVHDDQAHTKICRQISPKPLPVGLFCNIGKTDTPPSSLLWGDSHADALLPAFSDALDVKGRAGLAAIQGACAPLLGVDRPDAPTCTAFNNTALALARRPEIKSVLLVGRWAEYTDPRPYAPDDSQVLFNKRDPKTETAAEMSEAFAGGLERTVQALVAAGKRVVIVASAPESRVFVPETLALMDMTGKQAEVAPTTAEFLDRQQAAFALFERLKAKYGVVIIYPHGVLCASGRCEVVRQGVPLYRDSNHLSVYGARLLAPLFAAVL